MAHSLEKFFLLKKGQMPPVEFEMTPEQLRRPPPNKKNQGINRGKRVLPPGTPTADFLNNDKKPEVQPASGHVKAGQTAAVKHPSLPSQSVAGDRIDRLQ